MTYVNRGVVKVRRRYNHSGRNNKSVRNIAIGCSVMALLLATGYSAFQTVININAKGTIKDLKQEVDSKVPTNELLFWGQADNKENTLTTLKDKSGNNNDGILNNFDNTSASGYNDGKLSFDGINDYVNIGLANYDFNNSQTYVVYISLHSYTVGGGLINPVFMTNTEGSGMEIGVFNESHKARLGGHNGSTYIYSTTNKIINLDTYYTLIGTFDGTSLKLYVDGSLEGTGTTNIVTNSKAPLVLGGDPNIDNTALSQFTNFSLKEAMLYDRALTEEEVKAITDGFKRKYN